MMLVDAAPVAVATPSRAVAQRIGVALVAHSPLVLAGLQQGLQADGEVDVVLAAGSLEQARERRYGGARVLVAQADLPVAVSPGPVCVLLVPPSTRPALVVQALATGHTVLSQRASAAAIGAAARAAALGLVASSARWWADASEAPAEALTGREQEVLALMVEGQSNPQIAEALQISPHTAKYHVGQIIAKLEAGSRAHAVAIALRHGWA